MAKHFVVEELRVDELLRPLNEVPDKLLLAEVSPEQRIMSKNESLKRPLGTHLHMLFEYFGFASRGVQKRRVAAVGPRNAASAVSQRRGSRAPKLGEQTGRQRQQGFAFVVDV